MQDIPTLGGVGGGGRGGRIFNVSGVSGGRGGRIFNVSGVSGVDRRLQPHNHQNQQPLKCPRCDSQNTKFCYYNNYNLSQPRHYCKNCRRYWTKGGILRNVPVGGGCRKSKRSSKSKSSGDTSASNTYAATDSEKTELITSNSHSSSESSSLTTTTVSISGMPARLDNYPPLIEQHQEPLNGQMLPMTNMMSSYNEPGLVGSNQESQNDQEKIIRCNTTEMASMEFLDQHQDIVHVDLMALEPPNKEKNTGLATLDWGNVGTGGDVDAGGIDKHGGDVGGGRGGTEHGLFDFGGVDETYWNQVQWVDDNEQSFNFIPQFQVLDFNLENK